MADICHSCWENTVLISCPKLLSNSLPSCHKQNNEVSSRGQKTTKLVCLKKLMMSTSINHNWKCRKVFICHKYVLCKYFSSSKLVLMCLYLKPIILMSQRNRGHAGSSFQNLFPIQSMSRGPFCPAPRLFYRTVNLHLSTGPHRQYQVTRE